MEPVLGRKLTVAGRGIVASTYDGMWALARGLTDAEILLGRPLDSFKYGDTEYADVVGQCVNRQNFQGVSVSVI